MPKDYKGRTYRKEELVGGLGLAAEFADGIIDHRYGYAASQMMIVLGMIEAGGSARTVLQFAIEENRKMADEQAAVSAKVSELINDLINDVEGR